MNHGDPIKIAKNIWNENLGNKIPFLTFLASKRAGLDSKTFSNLSKQDFKDFVENFLTYEGNLDLPFNDEIKNPSDYYKTLYQHIYKSGYSYPHAFLSDQPGYWKFSEEYISLTKLHGLGGKKQNIKFILIYLYYKRIQGDYEDNFFLLEILEQFEEDFNISSDEFNNLFINDLIYLDAESNDNVSQDLLYTDAPLDLLFVRILKETKQELTVAEAWEYIKNKNWYKGSGKTPERTLNTIADRSLERHPNVEYEYVLGSFPKRYHYVQKENPYRGKTKMSNAPFHVSELINYLSSIGINLKPKKNTIYTTSKNISIMIKYSMIKKDSEIDYCGYYIPFSFITEEIGKDSFFLLIFGDSSQVFVLPKSLIEEKMRNSNLKNRNRGELYILRDTDGNFKINFNGKKGNESINNPFDYLNSFMRIQNLGCNEKKDENKEVKFEIDENFHEVFGNTDISLELIKEALKLKKQIILMGPPGTSKTYIATQLALELVDGKQKNFKMVQFHPAYSYEDFIECKELIEGTKTLLKFETKPRIFRTLCNEANDALKKKGIEDKFVLIIDEINRGNVERIFGELIYGLDKRGLPIKTLYSKDELTVPNNLYIIGTMNTVDLSIANIDAAIRRRFFIIEIMPDSKILENWYSLKLNDKFINFQKSIVTFMDNLNDLIEKNPMMQKYRTLGHAMYMLDRCNENSSFFEIWQNFTMVWEFTIQPTLLEYLNFSLKDFEQFKILFEKLENKFEKEIEESKVEYEQKRESEEETSEIYQKNMTPRQKEFKNFWSSFLDKIKNSNFSLFNNISAGKENWIQKSLGNRYLLSFVINNNHARVELSLEGDKKLNVSRFKELLKYKIELEEKLGNLDWNYKEHRKSQRLAKVVIKKGLKDKERWNEIQEIMIKEMTKYYEIIFPYIKKINEQIKED